MPSTSNNWYEGENKKCRRNSSATAITSILLFAVVVFLSIGPSACFSEGRLLGHSNVVNLVCRETRYPTRCVSSMMSYPRNQTATLRGLMYLGMRMSMEKAWRAYDMALSLRNKKMKRRERAAWRDCVEHFQATAEHINVCFSRNYNENDIPTWLSAALTRLDTCLNGFRDMKLPVTNPIRILMSSTAVNVSELVSNSLSMYNLHATSKNRRLLSADDQAAFESHYGRVEEDEFPEWLSVGDRRLLQSTSSQANVVVAEDGSGRYRTIGEAVKGAPQQSSKRYVIYVMAGVYRETINIPTSMPNLMFIGDGKDKTVVTGSKNVGISIHNCVVAAAPDLQPVVGSVQTYLGRPWKAYSRTVFMLSNLGSLINHAGWLPWSGNFALSTLYYSEYMNTGAGAGTSQRVNWPGFHVLASSSVAAQFTVGQFISGSSWIPATSTPFTAGLN